MSAISTTELFLIAMLIIFTIPYPVWRFGKTDYYAPLVVVQIFTEILLGPRRFRRGLSGVLKVRFHRAGYSVREWHRLVGSHDLRHDRRD